jgi:hypothetical protein
MRASDVVVEDGEVRLRRDAGVRREGEGAVGLQRGGVGGIVSDVDGAMEGGMGGVKEDGFGELFGGGVGSVVVNGGGDGEEVVVSKDGEVREVKGGVLVVEEEMEGVVGGGVIEGEGGEAEVRMSIELGEEGEVSEGVGGCRGVEEVGEDDMGMGMWEEVDGEVVVQVKGGVKRQEEGLVEVMGVEGEVCGGEVGVVGVGKGLNHGSVCICEGLGFGAEFGVGVFEGGGAVKDEVISGGIGVKVKVADASELEVVEVGGVREGGFDTSVGEGDEGIGVEDGKVGGHFVEEEAVIESNFGGQGVRLGEPVESSFDFAVGEGRAGLGVGVIGGIDV